MAVTTEHAAPYAPPSAILDVITRYRDRGLPTPINAEVLGRAGVSSSLIPRTLQALQTLDLIDEKGIATPTLDGLRRAPAPEYKHRLAEWLSAAYADVLKFIDPATADETAIRDAFRSYEPIGQQPRMVTLFVGLYAAAGVRQTEKRQSAPRPGARTAAPRPHSSKSNVRADNGGGIRNPAAGISRDMPPALGGLLASLPFARGGWTKDEREKFLTTFEIVLDYCLPIVEPSKQQPEEAESEEETF